VSAPPRLALEQLRKSFGPVTAVDGLEFALSPGEFVSLLGPSGCGKSTTLAMIAGFLAPDAGTIRIDGRDLGRLPPQARGVGLVFQDYALFSRLSVRANLAFGLKAQRVPRLERECRLARIVERLELGGLLDRPAARLNMSEMQRVALGRALITEPRLLLLDEPMSNLDAHLRQQLRTELKQIQAALDQTVLYVTHDQLEAMSMSNRIAVMHEGRLQQLGTPDAIYNRPVNRFVAEFIGDPPINVLPCTALREADDLRVTCSLGKAVRLQGVAFIEGALALAIRPHAIEAHRGPAAGSVPAVVRFVENLGAEHVLHVELGTHLLRVAAPPHRAAVGESVHLVADWSRGHLIEVASGRIAPQSVREKAARDSLCQPGMAFAAR
jgi:ABC-type sugar transport system ATPase subunit